MAQSDRVLNTKSRIIWIDSLKGFATICVVLGHVADGYLGAGLFPGYTPVLKNIYNCLYVFHMALFFMISGFIYRKTCLYIRTERSDVQQRIRIKNKCLNLVLLCFGYCVLMGLFKILFSQNVNKPLVWTDLLLIWGRPIAPYWYLYVLAIYYLVFQRVEGLTVRNRWILLAILAVASLASGYCHSITWFQIPNIMKYALYFYLGIWIVDNMQTVKWYFVSAALTVSVVISVLFWNDGRYITNIPIINTVAAFGITVFLFCLFKTLPFLDRKNLFSIIGKHSLEIYVFHCFFTAGNRYIFEKIGIKGFAVSIVMNTIISIVIPVMFMWLFRKIHLYNLFFAPGKLISITHDSDADTKKN